MKELVIQYVYAYLTTNGYPMSAAVFAVECKLDQSLLQATPPGDDLETIVTKYCDNKMSSNTKIIIPPVKRTRKKNWIIMEPHGSTVTMPTPINSFEHKRSHDQVVDETSNIQLHPPKRLCSSPRKSGTPRKHHTATPPIRSCDPIPMNPLEPGPSNQDDMLLLGNNSNSNAVDLDLLQSVITDSQLPQQLADSINAALQSVNTGAIATEGSCDPVATASDDVVDKILENTQSDLLELLSDLLPHDSNK